MQVRGRWWNGAWGRMARRDIWLTSDGHRWLVRGRIGGDDGHEVYYQLPDETSARAMVGERLTLIVSLLSALISAAASIVAAVIGGK